MMFEVAATKLKPGKKYFNVRVGYYEKNFKSIV